MLPDPRAASAVLPAQRRERAVAKPLLVFVHSPLSGRCRRAEGYLAQVLQRRRNHDTFRLQRLDAARRPYLVERFRVRTLPAILVVEGKALRGRLENPRGCREIAEFLEPWLR
jgi:thioredoxin-like negative regulator of GroEL